MICRFGIYPRLLILLKEIKLRRTELSRNDRSKKIKGSGRKNSEQKENLVNAGLYEITSY